MSEEHESASSSLSSSSSSSSSSPSPASSSCARAPPAPEVVCPPGGMTIDEYRTRAKEMVDYIGDYLSNIRSRRVFPNVSPGYLANLVPDSCPETPDSWDDIMADIERVIMPGMTHWQSPHMHAYFPALNSFPSLLGDMLADAINCLGFTWASSPACTELETVVMDWLGKMLGLPPMFLHLNGTNKTNKGLGGGCIQTTASDCTFVTLLAARTEAIRRAKVKDPEIKDAEINGRLIAYCSDQAHSSVEKAGLIGLVKLRFLATDDQLSLRGSTLKEAVTRDREMGFIPFYVCATVGTTGACAFDNIKEIGPVCKAENLWLHLDAAYAGSAMICPEFRHLMDGVEYGNSFAFNPSKWLMVHFDCTAMWVKDATALHRTFNVDPLYLQHENSGAAIDYMHWQVALSRRFRSLKLWFVLRSFGVGGLQAHIRQGVDRARHFEGLVLADRRFEVPCKRHLGMVVFRMVGKNLLTENLLKRLNKDGRVHMVPASIKGKYIIRFTVTSQYTTVSDIERDWKIIADTGSLILAEDRNVIEENSILEKEEEEREAETEHNADNDVSKQKTTEIPKNIEPTKEKEELSGNKFVYTNGIDNETNLHLNEMRKDDESLIGDDDNDNDINEAKDNDEDGTDVKGLKDKASKGLSFVALDQGHHHNQESKKTEGHDEDVRFPKNDAKSNRLPRANSLRIATSSPSAGAKSAPFRKAASISTIPKSAAAKRHDYGVSLLLSNVVPMSPKIMNASFAALFDEEDDSSSMDLQNMTRKLSHDGELIQLSPRKRAIFGSVDKQASLDYSVLSENQNSLSSLSCTMDTGSLDSKFEEFLELSSVTYDNGINGKRFRISAERKMDKISNTSMEDDSYNTACDGGFDVDRNSKEKEEEKDGGMTMNKNNNNKNDDGVIRNGSWGEKKCVEIGEKMNGNVNGFDKNIEEKVERQEAYFRGMEGRIREKENWDTGHKEIMSHGLKDNEREKGEIGIKSKIVQSDGANVLLEVKKSANLINGDRRGEMCNEIKRDYADISGFENGKNDVSQNGWNDKQCPMCGHCLNLEKKKE